MTNTVDQAALAAHWKNRIPSVVALQESMATQVLRFMIAMEQYPNSIKDSTPIADLELGRKLMHEELNKEMWPAYERYIYTPSIENLVEFVDGALDGVYVILWTLLKIGVPVDKCFAEIQRSNMAKLQADGTVLKNEFGKVQKPAGWTPPDLFGIVADAMSRENYVGGIATHKLEDTHGGF